MWLLGVVIVSFFLLFGLFLYSITVFFMALTEPLESGSQLLWNRFKYWFIKYLY